MLLLVCPVATVAQGTTAGEPAGAPTEPAPPTPALADLIPAQVALAGRLARLQQTLAAGPDLSPLEKRRAEIEADLTLLSTRLQNLQAATDRSPGVFAQLRAAVLTEGDALAQIATALSQQVRDLDAQRREWAADHRRWTAWQSSLRDEYPLEEVAVAGQEALRTIDAALQLLRDAIEPLLAAQTRAGVLRNRIEALAAAVDAAGGESARPAETATAPPLFSAGYLEQLRSALREGIAEGVRERDRADRRFYALNGWLIAVQAVLALTLVLVIGWRRQQLLQAEHWRFVARRPVSTAVFVAMITLGLLYEGSPFWFVFAYTLVAGVALVRLLGDLIERRRFRLAAVGVVTLLVANWLIYAIGLRFPWFRLYVFAVALLSLTLCLRAAIRAVRRGRSLFEAWGFGATALVLAGVVIGTLGPAPELAATVFVALVRTCANLLALWLLRRVMRGVVEAVIRRGPDRTMASRREAADRLVRRSQLAVDGLIATLAVTGLLVVWGVYDRPIDALSGLLSLGVDWGGHRLSVGLVATALGVFAGSLLLSRLLERALTESILVRRGVDVGVRISTGYLVRYGAVFVGFLLAITVLGLDLTNLTLVLSALGVGIGFGLQGLVNNVVSGFILLLERPVRVGDTIELDGQWSEILRIGLRSTLVRTFDRADVIVPNSDLISNPVTNWTLTDRSARSRIGVGVAYGSDVPLVIRTLIECATAHPAVMSTPPPQVLFLNFGESSLDFELRVRVVSVDDRLGVESELRQEIDRRFREAGIEIAFPQRDLHLRSVDVAAGTALRASDAPATAAEPRRSQRR